jgi:solute carrier family 12 sodium/potassium/chloride transporter 2
MSTPQPEGFGTFRGVLRPTLLTLLGALLVLREGWLVGSVGLLGAVAIILAAYVITGTTSLAVSSIATNVHMRAGGAFGIIAQALGLEAGGAIGIPLYIAQCASVALYLFAFAEGWAALYPSHPTPVVVLTALCVVVALAYRSAGAALKLQGVLLVVVAAALLSAWGGVITSAPMEVLGGVEVPEVSLREAFPIFFPAATGIMVGVGMSGSLSDPRESIPKGLLGAWGISLGVYLVTALWYAMVASPAELVTAPTIMATKAFYGPLVLAGLLCTTLMAALASLVSAPRLLAAMAEQRVVPFGEQLAPGTDKEPRRAVLVSAGVAGFCLLSGSLDAVAAVVTSVFILTYLAIQSVILIEQSLDMVSFRPTLRLQRWVPLIGVLSCGTALVLCSPAKGMLGLIAIISIYLWLRRRHLHTPWDTVRSGIEVRVADWAARRVAELGRPERAWTPSLLVPVSDAEEASAIEPLLARLTDRVGSVALVGLGGQSALQEDLQKAAAQLRQGGSHTTSTVLDDSAFGHGVEVLIDALRGQVFPPNLVLVDGARHSERDLQIILDQCHRRELGLAVFLPHPEGYIGRARDVTVWLSERSPAWDLRLHNTNLDLPVLLAYLLVREGRGRMRLSTVVRKAGERDKAEHFLRRLIEAGRLPRSTGIEVAAGDFVAAVRASPYADIHLLGIATTVDIPRLEEIRDAAGGACLFLMDSGQESVLA